MINVTIRRDESQTVLKERAARTVYAQHRCTRGKSVLHVAHARDATFLVVASRMHTHLVQDQEQPASNGNEDDLASARVQTNAEEP